LRGLGPEAQVFLDNSAVPIDSGGVLGQTNYLLLYPEAVTLAANPLAMMFLNYTAGPIIPQWSYTPRWGVKNASWPPPGLRLTVNYGAPPDPGPNNFTQLPGVMIGCAAPLACLTGWPTCDNSSVPGQCTFPRSSAVADCAAWPACKGVTCNDGRDDCQARGSLAQLSASGFTSFVRGGFFPYPSLTASVMYEMYDGVPALSKWVRVTNAGGTATSIPFVSQVTIENLHVPWEKRNRFHAETAYMPSQGIRNRCVKTFFCPRIFRCVQDRIAPSFQHGRCRLVPSIRQLCGKLYVSHYLWQ
jgi:hypothetical protein